MPPYAPNEDNEKAPIQDAESTTSADEIDPVAEKLLRRKLDWILLPLFTVACRSSYRIMSGWCYTYSTSRRLYELR